MTAAAEAVEKQVPSPVHRLLTVETPFGRPVRWAEVALVTDIGDTHALNDDRCLVLTSQDLSERAAGPYREFMLCVLADGATGSRFGPRGQAPARSDVDRQAGWRASQLAQAAFVERFLTSPEIDVLDRLKDGLRAADLALMDSGEGILSTTLVALFLSANGTAYAASIGDSVLLVLPPKRRTPGERRLKKLGYEDSTSVGSGDTTLRSVDQSQLIEQWWPNKEDGRADTRISPGTYLVLMSDGMSDNLPADFIDQLVHRHSLEKATVGLPIHTRERRTRTQKQGGGSTHLLGLDNMSAIVVRFDGARRIGRLAGVPRLDDASLFTLHGTHGGPTAAAGGQFGLVCLAGQDQNTTTAMPTFLRHFIESEHLADTQDRLANSFLRAMPGRGQARFAAVALDGGGRSHRFSSGGAQVDPGS
jgi:serine/threonine protein phosphatase PrpC